jgi:hypothetical protein
MAHVRVAVVSSLITAVLVGAAPARLSHSAAAQDTVRLASGSTVALATPDFIIRGQRYAFTWPGGGPPQTFTVKDLRPDGWILVEVAEENVDPNFVPFGALPVRWLHVGIATSIQHMRPLIQ